jgi:N-acetylmuramoyl-L-alanine amidase
MTSTSLPHEWIPAINFNQRRGGQIPEILLLHYTGTPTAEYAMELLTTDAGQVSCHYLVHEDGRIVHMVDEDMRAWHAGVSSWDGRDDVNSRSIGIEIVNPGHGDDYHDFPDSQIEAVIALSRDIISRHAIQPRHVLAHSDVAPGRKVDPGEKFPWAALARHGVGLWIDDVECLNDDLALREGHSGEQVANLRRNLKAFGYDIGQSDEFDGWTQTVVRTFQMHFRPGCCDGVADAQTINTLERLLASHAS